MRSKSLIPLLVCLLLAAACTENSATGPSVPLDREFTLAPGETASIEERGLRVQFLGVSGDSRCPADAVCIQGGDALVHIRVTGGLNSGAEYDLHTGDASRSSATHGDVVIQLVQLQPYPFSGRPTQPGDYRATLRATRS
jgi:hypothetical protein